MVKERDGWPEPSIGDVYLDMVMMVKGKLGGAKNFWPVTPWSVSPPSRYPMKRETTVVGARGQGQRAARSALAGKRDA